MVIRLASSSKPSAVEAALDAVTQRLDKEKPGAAKPHDARHVHFLSVNGIAPIPSALRVMLLTYIGVLLGLVLSLACANLANLLLARSSHRRKEIAIRLSVGAGRFRLVRQLLTESVMLSLAGGLGGCFFSYWLASMVYTAKFSRAVHANLSSVRPNLTILLLTLAISLITGIGFGLAPALATTRTDVATTLKQGALTPLRGYRRFGLRNLLVVYQVAGSLTLLLVTGYIVFGFGEIYHVDPGFDTRGIALFQIDPIRDGYPQEQVASLYEKLPRELSKVATVRSVTLAGATPFADMLAAAPNVHFSVPGPHCDLLRDAARESIGVHYFSTLGVPLVRGREFREFDQPNASGAIPALIDETMAREFSQPKARSAARFGMNRTRTPSSALPITSNPDSPRRNLLGRYSFLSGRRPSVPLQWIKASPSSYAAPPPPPSAMCAMRSHRWTRASRCSMWAPFKTAWRTSA